MTDALTDSFARMGIDPPRIEHPPVATVAEAEEHWAGLDAVHAKNLFLKDEGNRFWLILAAANQPIDLKALRFTIGSKRLRFAPPPDLERLLGVEIGAVSPLALINDSSREVTLVVDRELITAPAIALHPLRNTSTLALAPADLMRWLEAEGREVVLVDLG